MHDDFGPPSAPEASTLRLHVLVAIGFELGLALLALGVGWLVGYWPLVGMGTLLASKDEFIALVIGLVASIPPLVGLWWVESRRIAWLQPLRDLVRNLLQTWLGGASAGQLALVALAAGIGEEVLFRGLVQRGLADWIGPPWGSAVGLSAAALLFGVCHWLNMTYAFLAVGAGVYLGLLLELTGSLWTPLVAHAVYDFAALIILLRGPDPIR